MDVRISAAFSSALRGRPPPDAVQEKRPLDNRLKIKRVTRKRNNGGNYEN
jgi:hypothetical protein